MLLMRYEWYRKLVETKKAAEMNHQPIEMKTKAAQGTGSTSQ
jgi:hypothetical protein